MLTKLPVLLLLAFQRLASAVNFAWEETQLTEDDIDAFNSIAFADTAASISVDNTATSGSRKCKVGPWDAAWPTKAEWAAFNTSLDGALIKTVPQGAVCYPNDPHFDEAACTAAVQATAFSGGVVVDPSNIVQPWIAGEPCDITETPIGNCSLGGFPVYIVNATTVKHVQLGVNFARNMGIRLVVKNTGHDFGGRSVGAGALSIWLHNLQGQKFVPDFSVSGYRGPAVRIAGGTQGWQVYNFMADNNITVVAPGESTIAVLGGFTAVGGHGSLTSYYGMGSDQALQLQVVTADGKFLQVDADNSADLFFAMRGGGGSTYGIVTSAVIKAFPPLTLQTAQFMWSGSLDANFPPTIDPSTGAITVDKETFWSGVREWIQFSRSVSNAGGIGFSYIEPPSSTFTGPPSGLFQMTGQFILPGQTLNDATALLEPFFSTMAQLGIPLTQSNATTITSQPYNTRRTGQGDPVGNGRFSSRLFPHANWEDPVLFNATVQSIRAAIEDGGYTVNAIPYSPTEAVSGFPNDAVNPAFRQTAMHAIAKLTPGSGAYMNEADMQEPEWQQSFFGDHYPRLLDIKRRRDPWGVFWAPTTPGSEAWEVVVPDGLPLQTGTPVPDVTDPTSCQNGTFFKQKE
ncbi:FAD-binding domain-containing protein [Mycena venus]|uniref:FAD-binding domain-containing protein n=1 Tax=Mycena venus TaxID=2733690 RepID=A0A8H6Y087_9AGAR|nr:FAD-binding domain-containing protein [Mycena venus]